MFEHEIRVIRAARRWAALCDSMGVSQGDRWDECPAYGCDDGECSCRFDEEADERVHDAVCDCSVGAIEKAVALIRAAQSE